MSLGTSELHKRLEWFELQLASPATISATRNLKCWLDKEATMWYQWSQISWFQSGNRNTRFSMLEQPPVTRKTSLQVCWIPMEFGKRKSMKWKRLWLTTTRICFALVGLLSSPSY